MRPIAAALTVCVLLAGAAAPAGAQVPKVAIGWCSRTVSSAGAPFSIATKMGWFKAEGIDEETIENRRREMVAVAKGYAMGTVFAIANPEAAVRIHYEMVPSSKPTGKDEATAVRDDVKVLQARIVNWKLDKAGVKRWGENSEPNYAAYVDFMLKWGVIKEKVDSRDLITNDLIDDVNKFDPAKVAAEAKGYKAR